MLTRGFDYKGVGSTREFSAVKELLCMLSVVTAILIRMCVKVHRIVHQGKSLLLLIVRLSV